MAVSTQEPKQSTTERKRVRYDSTATDIRAALSATFGRMVELAAPMVAFHLGDLYYDARWLHENANGTTFTFLWSFDDTGTNIGTIPETLNRAHGYRITLTLDKQHHTWLTIAHATHTATTGGSGSVSGALPTAAVPDRGTA